MKNKKTKAKEFPLIYLEWCDAISHPSAWVDFQSAINWADNEDWLICQAAWLIKETDEYLLVTSQFNPQPDGENRFSILHKIPKTWIRKQVVLSII